MKYYGLQHRLWQLLSHHSLSCCRPAYYRDGLQSCQDLKLDQTFEPSCHVRRIWNSISYNACCSLANCRSFAGISNSIVLSVKNFKTKPRKSSVLAEFTKDSSNEALPSYALFSLNLVFTKFF